MQMFVNIKVNKKYYLQALLKECKYIQEKVWWRRGVVVITTAQLHSTKLELSFCAGSNPAQMVPAGNKAKRLSSVNHTIKTNHHHHHHHHHHKN